MTPLKLVGGTDTTDPPPVVWKHRRLDQRCKVPGCFEYIVWYELYQPSATKPFTPKLVPTPRFRTCCRCAELEWRNRRC